MKKYAVFAGNLYYPSGGWNDYREEFDTLNEAEAYIEAEFENWNRVHAFNVVDGYWWQIVDLQNGKIVTDGEK